MKAEYLSGEKKKQALLEISPLFDTVKILIRLTHNLSIIPEHEYIKLEENLQEIGKMLGGWIRSL